MASKSTGFTMLWAPRALKMQTLGTKSSISNSQNENSLDLGLSAGFQIGVAGSAGGRRGVPEVWKVMVLQCFGHLRILKYGLWVPIPQSPILKMRIH